MRTPNYSNREVHFFEKNHLLTLCLFLKKITMEDSKIMPPLNPTMAKTDEPSVLYDTTDHISVIFSLYASIWP